MTPPTHDPTMLAAPSETTMPAPAPTAIAMSGVDAAYSSTQATTAPVSTGNSAAIMLACLSLSPLPMCCREAHLSEARHANSYRGLGIDSVGRAWFSRPGVRELRAKRPSGHKHVEKPRGKESVQQQ